MWAPVWLTPVPFLAHAMAPCALALVSLPLAMHHASHVHTTMLPQAMHPVSRTQATMSPPATLPATHVQAPMILPRQSSYASLPPKSVRKRVISIWPLGNSTTKMPSAPISTAQVGRLPPSPAPISRDSFSPTPSALATFPSSWIYRTTYFARVARFWRRMPTPIVPAPTYLGCLTCHLRGRHRRRRLRHSSPGRPAVLILAPLK